jgi:hypothetical protein
VGGVGPGVPTLVALVGDQSVADHDEQASLGRLRQKATCQVAQRCTEPGVSGGRQPEAARRHEPAILEVLEATDFDPVSGVAGEHEDAVSFPGQRHCPGKRVGTRQFEFEYPAAVHAQR